MKDQILKLRAEGKSYKEIKEILGCSKGTISYYLGKGQKEKTYNRTKKRRAKHTLVKRVEGFKYKLSKQVGDFQRRSVPKYKKGQKRQFGFRDVLAKIGENPTCYLTGDSINLNEPRTYELDHIIPPSKGGNNSLDNLGLVTRQVNRAKQDMTPEELILLCQKILNHHGYDIKKRE